jgi:hypothetical protein
MMEVSVNRKGVTVMAKIRRQITLLVSDPKSARLFALGLAVIGLLAALGAPAPVAACMPPGDGGIGGC